MPWQTIVGSSPARPAMCALPQRRRFPKPGGNIHQPDSYHLGSLRHQKKSMQMKSRKALTNALASWGEHEAKGRLAGKVRVDTANPMACVEFALLIRSPYVGRILLRDPQAVFEVELDAADIGNLVLSDGRSVEAWQADTAKENGESAAHVQRLIQEPVDGASKGHLICAATLVQGDPAQQLSDIVLYDGWHRAAAFLERVRLARAKSIHGYLVLTRTADRYLPAGL